MNARRVVVVGGGLAGITTALRCADAGCAVTLLESRPRLGGLTHSFRRGNLWVDNGQHVFLRCCTSYRGLLERLGTDADVTVQDRLDVAVRSEATGGTQRLRRNQWPAPLHLAGALARYGWLTPAERVQAVRAAAAMRGLDRHSPEVDRTTFGEWLAAHGQSPRAVAALWELIGIATLNARAEDASLALAATVFQVGLLDSSDAGDIGWSLVPLQQLHGDPAGRELASTGAEVRTRCKVTGLEPDRDGWRVDVSGRDGTQRLETDAVVLAVPPTVAEDLLPSAATTSAPGWSTALGSSPIINAHVVYDRQVLAEPFVAAVDSPLQWVFDRTEQSGVTSGQYVAVSLSAADDLLGRPVEELRAWLLPRLERLLRPPADAGVRDFFVTREPHATFRSSPGSGALRPGPRTRCDGLHLAGAWTDTGWPATMEGAVRSGEAAAASVLELPAREVAA